MRWLKPKEFRPFAAGFLRPYAPTYAEFLARNHTYVFGNHTSLRFKITPLANALKPQQLSRRICQAAEPERHQQLGQSYDRNNSRFRN